MRILGGLMALGYEIGTIMKRTSVVYSDDRLTIKFDDIEGMGSTFLQVQGKDRTLVGEVGKQLGLEGTYIPRSYIEQVRLVPQVLCRGATNACARVECGYIAAEAGCMFPIKRRGPAMATQPPCAPLAFLSWRCNPQVQLSKLTAAFQTVTEDMKRRFVVDGEPQINEFDVVGCSPMSEGAGSFRRNVGFLVPPSRTMSSSGLQPHAVLITLPV